MASSSNDAEKTIPPSKLAHVVLRTSQFEQMKKFYKSFLGAHAVYENEMLAFLSYDDEHHRIALINMPHLKAKDSDTCGLEHIAFTFDSLKDLRTAYKQRKATGIEPGWCTVGWIYLVLEESSTDRTAESRSNDINVLSRSGWQSVGNASRQCKRSKGYDPWLKV